MTLQKQLSRLKWDGEPGQGYSRLYMIVTPRFVRASGSGWGGYLRARPSVALSYWRVFRSYLANLRMDFHAWMDGDCNGFLTKGYSFWRCERRAHHAGPHRSNNYEWDGRGPARYVPLHHLDRRSDAASRRPYRKPTRNLRQSIAWRLELRADRERRRLERLEVHDG